VITGACPNRIGAGPGAVAIDWQRRDALWLLMLLTVVISESGVLPRRDRP